MFCLGITLNKYHGIISNSFKIIFPLNNFAIDLETSSILSKMFSLRELMSSEQRNNDERDKDIFK